MDSVVFIRGVNTGSRTLKTADFAESVSEFRLLNLGAAGTFVVQGGPPSPTVGREVRRRLPFDAEVAVVPAIEVERLVHSRPFDQRPGGSGVRRAVSILAAPPKDTPNMPFGRPSLEEWGVRVMERRGVFVLSESRRLPGNRMVYPNEVVERAFGTVSTTRWWETLERVAAILSRATSP